MHWAAVVLFLILMAWCAWNSHRIRAQRQRIARLELRERVARMAREAGWR